MSENSVKVLHYVPNFKVGGIESFLINLYKEIDKEKVQFDILVEHPMNSKDKNFFESKGAKIIQIPKLEVKNIFKHIICIYKILKKNKYIAVHNHSFTARPFVLILSKYMKIPIRITHAHTTSYNDNSYTKVRNIITNISVNCANKRVACSKTAGKFIYKEKEFEVIYNGIEYEKFKYNQDIRVEYRKNMNLNERFVLGHIGRFTYAKNYEYIINVFEGVYKKNNNAHLVLVGDGSERSNIEKLVNYKKLNDVVSFLGAREDVDKIYQAIDVFLLPSRFEGFPVTLLEAQSASKKCIVSRNITNEIDLGLGLITYIDIGQINEDTWINCILKNSNYEAINYGEEIEKSIIKNGFDLKKIQEQFYNLYNIQ